MHDLLKFFSMMQTLSSGKSLIKTIGYLAASFFVLQLWISDDIWAKAISFVAVDIALYFVVTIVLSNPIEFFKVLSLKIFFLFLSVLRIGIKVILVILASILSLVYFISPIDFIPDVLLGFGWIDDVLIFVGLISAAANSDLEFPEPCLKLSGSYPVLTGLLAGGLSTVLTYLARILSS